MKGMMNMYCEQDAFYEMKRKNVKTIREIFRWADENGLVTRVTMLEVHKSWSRTNSDKSFDEVLGLMNRKALPYFRIVLRKNMSLFMILTDKRVLGDILEIFIRGIDVDGKEYFISILLDKKYLDFLVRKYGLKMI